MSRRENALKSSINIRWAERLKRIVISDLRVCPLCVGHVIIIAAIVRKEVIQNVLESLYHRKELPKMARSHEPKSFMKCFEDAAISYRKSL
jgi:hypothetical protein